MALVEQLHPSSTDQRKGMTPMRAVDSDGALMVHVATRVTDEVFSFLGPATSSMVSRGWAQVVIAFDEPGTRARLGGLASIAELRLVPTDGDPLSAWLRLRAAVKAVLKERSDVAGLHLHGFVPSLLGMSVVRSLQSDAPVFFSPHSSNLLGPLRFVGRLSMALIGALSRDKRPRPIVSLESDFHRLDAMTDSQISLVESPVSSRFFKLVRAESARPTIVAGSHVGESEEALAMFLRFAVLLRDSKVAPEFVWLGRGSQEQHKQMKAANVRMVDPDDESSRLRVLSTAWVYVAPSGGRGVPVGLAEALAGGLPCVAADTMFHRDVVAHLRTGLLYRTPAEALDMIASLLDSTTLRSKLGRAAREEAYRRFDDARFGDRLELVYRQASAAANESAAAEAPRTVING